MQFRCPSAKDDRVGKEGIRRWLGIVIDAACAPTSIARISAIVAGNSSAPTTICGRSNTMWRRMSVGAIRPTILVARLRF
jgi:hypothetical protein